MNTIGEKYRPAMEIHDQEEADAYFEQLVQHTMENTADEKYKTRAGAEALERGNLGYFAGYYDADTRRRVERLFRCAHPICGSIEEKGQPTSEEALNMGLAMGKMLRDTEGDRK